MAERGEVESRILDAAERVFAERGVRRARMGEVAEAAGCSRATLYRYFATKEALVADYALRELERISETLLLSLATRPALGDRLVEALAIAVEAVRARPAIAPFLSPEAQGLTSALPIESGALGPALLGTFVAVTTGHDGRERLRPEIPEAEILEWSVRVILSLALAPGPSRTPSELRGFLGRLVRPSFVVPSPGRDKSR